ncbi:MAG: hypothetical protein M1539_04825 [Actinobacteria bacterium]|nr:hypothetical protein [Actinomycetota bacterium]
MVIPKNICSLLFFLVAMTLAMAVMPRPAEAATAYTIAADGTGCSALGNWNAATKTCSLTHDVIVSGTGGVTLAGEVTLEGAGHSLTGDNTPLQDGVYINGVTATGAVGTLSVRNLRISNFDTGVGLSNTNKAYLLGNKISGCTLGVYLTINSGNVTKNGVLLNTIQSNTVGVYVLNSNNNDVSANDFIGNTTQAIITSSTGTGVSSNYWDNYDTRGEGCINTSPFNMNCDAPYSFAGGSDSSAMVLRGAYGRENWTWYDDSGGDDWILLGSRNPAMEVVGDLWYDLSIGAAPQMLGHSTPTAAAGLVPMGTVMLAKYPGLMGGPVTASSSWEFQQSITSQRILWPKGGNSLEEVPGTDARSMDSRMYWPWYDMQSPGFKDWILISNPNSYQIHYNVRIAGVDRLIDGIIPAGSKATPTFPGVMGGPVQVDARNDSGDPAFIMASERVLTNDGMAFNEVPGTPQALLANDYLWTWYDMGSEGARNWVLIANPSTKPDNSPSSPVWYEIWIGGHIAGQGGPIAPGANENRVFPGTMDGPVEVKTFLDAGHTPPASSQDAPVIVSQRSTWGPSFEEVPGKSKSSLNYYYDWTWYDQQSPGARNWVLIGTTPGEADSVTVEVSFTDKDTGLPVILSHDITPPEKRWIPTFDGKMGGPVHVKAYKQGTPGTTKKVIASQRVIWNGYFNEVLGQ